MKKWTACLLLAARAAIAQPSAMAPGVIAGTVVNSIGNTPLGKVLVSISPVEVAAVRQNPAAPSPDRFVVTESDGRFTFLNVAPGKYRLSAARPNDRPQQYLGQGMYSTAIAVGVAGVDTTSLVFPYHMPGSINGSIADEKGDEVRNATVTLFRRDMSEGQIRIQQAGQAVTRSGGTFHFGHLEAGDYFIAVAAQPWYVQSRFARVDGAPPTNANPEFDVAYPLTYYAGVTDFSQASPIRVSEGGSATAQITLHAVPAVHIRITGMQGQTNRARGGATVTAVGPGGQVLLLPGAFAGPTGELSGIAPGRYRVTLQNFGGGRMQMGGPGKVVDLTGDQTIDFQGLSPIQLSGTVAVEGPDKPMNRLMIVLNEESNRWAASATAGEDGKFAFRHEPLRPGRYQVSMPNNPAFYLKNISAKGAKLTGNVLEISENAIVELSLLLAPNAQRKIEGHVVRDNRPVAGAMVLLLPTTAGREHLIRRDQSDLDGSFQLGGIAPGQYRLVAIDDGRDLAYRDPSALQPYLSGAAPLTIAASAATEQTQDIRLAVQSRIR